MQFVLLELDLLPQKSPCRWCPALLSKQLAVRGFAKSERAVNRGVGLEKGGQPNTDKTATQNASLEGFFFLSLFKFWYFTTVSGFGNRRVLTFSVWCWQYWIKEIKGPVMEHTSCL